MKQIKEVLEGVYNNIDLRKSIVPLFIGNPGMGKTVAIEEFAKEKGVALVELITSQMSPFEISGIAMPDKETKQMMYYNFDKLENLKDGDILFFDELLNGNPIVLNACLTILEQRRFISGKPLPNIMIVAAANPQGMVPLTPQIKERFVWINVKFNKESWCNYMIKKYNIITSINDKLVSLITKEEFTGNNFNTPRSIDKAVNMIIHNVPTPYSEIVKPILSELVTNTSGQAIPLSETKQLEPNEQIMWLNLIRYQKGLTVDVETQKQNEFVLPEKWFIRVTEENQEILGEWREANVKLSVNGLILSVFNGIRGWWINHELEPTEHSFVEITTEHSFVEITTEQFIEHVYNPWLKKRN